MALTKYKLGEFIERSTANNRSLKYKEDLIVGVTSDGVFSSPKGNVDGVDLTPYKIVNDGDFVYNPSRFDLGSIAYRTEGLCIVSHLYQIFHLNEKGKKTIDPYWLFIYLRRKEFRREITFRNFGSQRPEFNFNDLSDIELPLPSIEQQRKYVDVYLALQNNLAAYQSKVDDLKLVCDGYIEELRRKMKCEKIGKYLQEEVLRNSDYSLSEDNVLGVTKDKTYIKTVANLNGIDLSNYKVVKPRQFAYSNRINIGSIALRYDTPCLVSPSYTVFSVNEVKILSEYLLLWLSRSEFLHYAFFYSIGTVKDEMDVDDIGNLAIPIPDISIQREIVNIHKCYIERQRIAESLKEQLKNICPVLIRGSLEE